MRPPSTSGPQPVADKTRQTRQRGIGATAVSNAAGRVVAVAASLATVPLVMHHLSPEHFGLWMVIVSLTSLLGFADLGIGNGMLTAVADAYGRDDAPAIRRLTSSAVATLCVIAIVFGIASAIVWPLIDWARLFGIRGPDGNDLAERAVAVFMVCFAVGIPLGVTQRVQIGLQRGYVAAAWQAAGSVLALLAVYVMVRQDRGLPALVAAMMGVPILTAALNSLSFFKRTRPDLSPSFSLVKVDESAQLLRLGGLFLALQVTVAIAFAADNLIAAHLLGAAAIADYAVAAKVFSASSVLILLMLQPLWPAYGEAIARRDADWVHRAFSVSTRMAVAASAGLATVLLIGFDWLTGLWLGRHLEVSWVLLGGLAFWMIVEAAGNCVSMLLNAARVVGLQVSLALAFATVCVAGKLAAIPAAGVSVIPWITIVSYLVVSLLPAVFTLKHLMRRLRMQSRAGA